MANEKNLKPIMKGELSSEEAKKRGHAGGVASVKARRQKKKLKELVEMFGEMGVAGRLQEAMKRQGIKGEDMTNKMAAVVGLYKKAQSGDVCAFNAIRDIIGEKPKDVVDNNFVGDVNIRYVPSGKKFASSEDEVDEG